MVYMDTAGIRRIGGFSSVVVDAPKG